MPLDRTKHLIVTNLIMMKIKYIGYSSLWKNKGKSENTKEVRNFGCIRGMQQTFHLLRNYFLITGFTFFSSGERHRWQRSRGERPSIDHSCACFFIHPSELNILIFWQNIIRTLLSRLEKTEAFNNKYNNNKTLEAHRLGEGCRKLCEIK